MNLKQKTSAKSKSSRSEDLLFAEVFCFKFILLHLSILRF